MNFPSPLAYYIVSYVGPVGVYVFHTDNYLQIDDILIYALLYCLQKQFQGPEFERAQETKKKTGAIASR